MFANDRLQRWPGWLRARRMRGMYPVANNQGTFLVVGLPVSCADLDHCQAVGKLFNRSVKLVTKQCEQCLICDIAGGSDKYM